MNLYLPTYLLTYSNAQQVRGETRVDVVCVDVTVGCRDTRALLSPADQSLHLLRRVDQGQLAAAGPPTDQRHVLHRVAED